MLNRKDGTLLPEVRSEFMRSSEWMRFDDQLLVLAPRDSPETKSPQNRKKPGPKSDPLTAQRVAEIVNLIAPDGEWAEKDRLAEITDKLDEMQIPIPQRWRGDKNRKSWINALDNGHRELVIKAIKQRLNSAKRTPPLAGSRNSTTPA